MLTRKAKYALRALCVLAEAYPQRIPACRLAREARVPEKFLEAIMVELRNAGLVESRRGADGGHSLAREAEAITIGAIVRTIDGPIAPIRCASLSAYEPCGDCITPDTCALRALMSEVRIAISGVLDQRSLAALAAAGCAGQAMPEIGALLD